MKILIADDDAVSRDLLAEILNSAKAGYVLLTAIDGANAWQGLEQNPDVKLAIVDLAMPTMNGLELLERIRSDARFATLPVIVCTGTADRATVAAVAARGVSQFLVKPFTRTTVLEKVWQVCRPPSAAMPVVRDLAAARQRYEIDRDTHRELLAHFVRVADMWAADARRATDFARVRSLAIRAGHLKQMLNGLGAAGVGAKLQEAEDVLGAYRTKPLAAEITPCLRATNQLGEKVQKETDRLRDMLDTLV